MSPLNMNSAASDHPIAGRLAVSRRAIARESASRLPACHGRPAPATHAPVRAGACHRH
jgi:hypothetical protein